LFIFNYWFIISYLIINFKLLFKMNFMYYQLLIYYGISFSNFTIFENLGLHLSFKSFEFLINYIFLLIFKVIIA